MTQGTYRSRISIGFDHAGACNRMRTKPELPKVPCVMRYRDSMVSTKMSEIYDHGAMVVIRDPGHVSRSDFDCRRSYRVHMIECARNPSSESALGREMLQCALTTKRSKIYDHGAMVVTDDPGHVSRSDFDCRRSCRVHMIECARNPSSESALGYEMS